MFRMTFCFAAPAFVVLMGGTAHAALTADQVWQSWKDAGAMIGLEVSAATENTDGGTLTLNGVTVAPAGMAGVRISDMRLVEQSDGSVTISPGADIGIDLTGDTEGSARIVHDGLTMTAREANGGLAYDFAAAKLDVVYDTTYPSYPSFDGTTPPETKASGTVGLSNLSGTYSDTPGTNRTFGLGIKAGALAYNTSLDDAGLEMKQTTSSDTADIDLSFELALPSSMSLADMAGPEDLGTALQEGLAVSFTSRQGTSVGSMTQESAFFPMSMEITAGGGDGSGVFNKDTFSVQSQGAGLDVKVNSGMMPVPVQVTSGPIMFGMTAPVIANDTAGDFGLVLKFSQFSVNEEAWAMVDPGAAFSRDAADLAIDISGKTKIDVPAMIAADEMGGMPPLPAPENLDITELSLKVAGAALAGTGAFTFDNSMGMPMPIGAADVSISGANALIDGLIATGILAQEDAMGARMMMGAFMSPGAGPDTLTSRIEAKPGFEIYVNGQRIQ
jgi:hypothetical protein